MIAGEAYRDVTARRQRRPLATYLRTAGLRYLLLLIAVPGLLLLLLPRDFGAPLTPAGLSATVFGPRSLRLEWAGAADDCSSLRGRCGPISYRVYENGALVARPVDRTAIHRRGRTPNTLYCYRVEAFTTLGSSDSSEELCITTAPLPRRDPARHRR